MRVIHLLLAFALVATTACSSKSPAPPSADTTPAGQVVTVDVRPPRAWVEPGGSVSFKSVVTGTADTGVTWDVVEPGGGTVSTVGVYSAPLKSGTYTVTASNGNGKALGHGKVTVGAVTVAISPTTTAVAAGATVAFTAMVAGTTDTAVTWSVREASGCGSVDATGVYTAPAAAATCHVDATSVASPTVYDEATVTVSAPPVAAPAAVVVAVSPSSGAVDACQSLTFSATVSGTTDGTVTWSVQEGSAGGSVTSAGVYTAPPTAGTYHLIATSLAAPTSSTVVPVTVSDHILGVAVSPSTISLAPGATAQFTATVTSSCGTFSSTQTVTAPN